ncbi:hypothetical protein HN789_01095 [archaeon]|jgi:hypothetical protein|nr:hypothetical protein [archaeon]MBT4022126.1 hypothetical protein [archaeon]MBT4272739.1 hypothetical protein [archaeon]MBT4461538.1 hypothetical protein [archaeon]MBT4857694.1 hypothetical protein [archaeon]
MDPRNSVVIEFINSIFLNYSPQYNSIKDLAKKDLAEEFLSEIEEFLSKRKEFIPQLKKIKRIIGNPSTINDKELNEVMDILVLMKERSKLDKSIDRDGVNVIMNMFESLMHGVSQKNELDISWGLLTNENIDQMNNLEKQLIEMQTSSEKGFGVLSNQKDTVYQTQNLQQDIYSNFSQSVSLEQNNSVYSSKEDDGYKAMKPNL